MKTVSGNPTDISSVTVTNLTAETQQRGVCLPSSRPGSGQANTVVELDRGEGETGGRVTNSPPAKVDTVPGNLRKILASGVDSLALTIDVIWNDPTFLEYLECQKALAKSEEKETAIFLGGLDGEERLLLSLQPYGHKGHEWVLAGGGYHLTIGNWLVPKSRPAINVTIRSELLWSVGPETAVDFLLHLLRLSGARILIVKPSRVDLCVDYLMPQQQWSEKLKRYIVTRAGHCSAHSSHSVFSGFSIGKGNVAGRLYDKPLEIKQQSRKFWMYDVWGIGDVPEGFRLIRVEGQFRREVIKEVGIDHVSELFSNLDSLWAYFTQNWLKFQNNPGKHHLSRKTLPFWVTIQKGFLGVQGAHPLIRCQTSNAKETQLAAQTYGTMSSLIALTQEKNEVAIGEETTLAKSLAALRQLFKQQGKSDFELNIDILDKRAKHHKITEKMIAVQQQRAALGFPSNLPPLLPDDEVGK